jgi:hypothetical protein
MARPHYYAGEGGLDALIPEYIFSKILDVDVMLQAADAAQGKNSFALRYRFYNG